MPANPDRRFRPRMTLLQIGKLVAIAAVASAVVMPQVREAGDLRKVLIILAVEPPLVLIPATVLLVRRGPLKLWLVTFLCAMPLASLLIALNFFLAWIGAWNEGSPATRETNRVVIVACETALVLCLFYLARPLVPRRCPLCGRTALLRDVSVPRSSHFSTRTEPRTCLACGARFRRPKGSGWVDVDTLPSNHPARILR